MIRSSSIATPPGARVNHWITATCLVLLAISGLGAVLPELLLPHRSVRRRRSGRGRFIPGSALYCSSASSDCSCVSGKRICGGAEDGTWLARLRYVLTNEEDKLPEVGKYNAGQKVVFWSMSILIIVLICTGIVIWDQYFYPLTSIEQKRWAILVHSLAAVTIICVWIVHVYAAIWLRGTIGAMTRGQVTGGWAWKHHRKWLKELVTGKGSDRTTGTTPVG